MKLTDAQRWALQAIRDGHAATPAWLGQKMMERPGVDKTKGRGLKAQGYGRLGGTMVARLERMGPMRWFYLSQCLWVSVYPTGNNNNKGAQSFGRW